jgi:two-component system, OmpR family, response regulator CpxR
MYASVEMLLKFCVENFRFKCTDGKLRAKRGCAQTPPICNEENLRWLRRHFTRDGSADRIQFALVDFSAENCEIFRARSVRALRKAREMKPKRTILCVDDNEQSLSIRKVMLETRGYRVLAFSDAQQALNRFIQGGVDLVLTDLVMPGIDGSKLVQSVKNLSPETPAILLSGKVKIYEQETGADVFLAKGMYAPADLLERIRLLLVRKRGPKRAIARTQVPPPTPYRIASA